MKATDAAWLEWVKTPSRPIVPGYTPALGPCWGPTEEPDLSLCLASFVAPLRLAEPFALLDYGCGEARLANFISERFSAFTYYGLERDNVWGRQALDHARANFAHDPRVFLGTSDGSAVEVQAMNACTHAVLLSVFTHLKFDRFEHIMARIAPILNRGGRVSFSVFLDLHEHQRSPGVYDADDYMQSFYTMERLQAWATCNDVNLVHVEDYAPVPAYAHSIFTIEGSRPR